MTGAGSASRRGVLLAAGAALLALAAGVAAGRMLTGDRVELPLRKFDLGVELEDGAGEPPEVAISPDGTHVAFTYQDRLWVQPLDALEPRHVEGTAGAFAPFWSPDGEEIGYFVGNKLFKIPAVGGRGIAIADLGGDVAGGRGASWAEDGRIVVSRGNSGILQVSSLGGDVSELLPLIEGEGDVHQPHVLPGGRGIVFVSHPADGTPSTLVLLRDGERHVLRDFPGDSIGWPVYSPSGHVVFERRGPGTTNGLWALPFSLRSLKPEGEPFLVVPRAGGGSTSRDGALAFVHRPPSGGLETVVWVDRGGRPIEPVGGERRAVDGMSLSPDGRRMAFGQWDVEDRQFDLWVRDLERETETRLTVDGSFEFRPRWTPAGDRIVYGTWNPEGALLATWVVPADGSGEPRLVLEHAAFGSLTPDGKSAVVVRAPEGEKIQSTGDTDLWLVAVDGDEEPRAVLTGPDRTTGGDLSPDGKWLVYRSERTNRNTLYLTRFPEATGRWQLSTGAEPDHAFWDPRGDRIYFTEGSTLIEVSFEGGTEPKLGKATPLFDLADDVPRSPRGPTISRDGERFAVVRRAPSETEDSARSGLKVVQNWFREFED